MRIVFERRRAEQQDVPPERGDRRNRAIRRPARMPGRTPQPLRLVDDEQVDAGRHRLRGQLRPFDQRLERDHRAAMGVERVEAGAEVARDVGQARRVEQREHLVILAPQLAQPLHRQRLGGDDQAALDLLRVQQPVHDQRGFDGLAQPDFVCEQPSHRHPRGRAFRDVQLMREQPDPPTEERSEAARLARREQVQDVEAGQEVFGVVDVARGQPLEQRPVALLRVRRFGHERVAAGREPERGTRSAENGPTSTRPSIAVTRPVPSSGLKRWVRWSPTDQACTTRFYRITLGHDRGSPAGGAPSVATQSKESANFA